MDLFEKLLMEDHIYPTDSFNTFKNARCDLIFHDLLNKCIPVVKLLSTPKSREEVRRKKLAKVWDFS